MFDQVIVPLDGSEESARALDVAASIARSTGAGMTVVGYALPSWLSSLRADLDDALRALDADGLDVEVVTEVPDAPMGEALATMSAGVPNSLICMSTHGRGRSEALVGSVANSLLRHTERPVLLVGPSCETEAFDAKGLLTMTTDGGRTSEAALSIVEDWARAFNNKVELISVLEPGVAGGVGDGFEASHLMRLRKEIKVPGTDVEFEVLHDTKPARAIVDRLESTGSALVAMATHGAEGFARITAGSVTSTVVRHAPCPVLAVRPTPTDQAAPSTNQKQSANQKQGATS